MPSGGFARGDDRDVVAADDGEHSDLDLRLVADKCVSVHAGAHTNLVGLDREVFDRTHDDACNPDRVSRTDRRRIGGVERDGPPIRAG